MESRNMFSRIFGKKKQPPQNLTRLRMLNGYSNGYTPFSGAAYDDATVRSCVDTIARHASKLNPRHIVKKEGKVMRVLDDRLNYLLSVQPNPLMTSAEFIEKLVNQYFTTNNLFVYIQRDITADVIALWPLDFSQVSLYEDSHGVIYAKFTFGVGLQTTVPYEDIVHIRRHYNRDEMFGDPEARMLQEDLTKAEESLRNANLYLEKCEEEEKKTRLKIKAQRNTWEAIAACLVVALVVK